MLIPFLAATAIAATFAHLGAMSVQISILPVAGTLLAKVQLSTSLRNLLIIGH